MLEIKLDGLDDYARYLSNATYWPRIMSILERGVSAILDLIRAETLKETPVNTGLLRSSINASKQVMVLPTMVQGTLGSTLAYALPTETGRAPGKMPPVDAIAYWVARKGLAGTYDISTHKREGGAEDQRSQDWQVALMIARKIAARGTKGAHMMEKGIAAAQPRIEAYWQSVIMPDVAKVVLGE